MKKKDLKKATEILDRKAEKKQKRKANKGYQENAEVRMKEIRGMARHVGRRQNPRHRRTVCSVHATVMDTSARAKRCIS